MYDTETGRALREQEQELSNAFIEKYGEQLRLHLENQVRGCRSYCRGCRRIGCGSRLFVARTKREMLLVRGGLSCFKKAGMAR